MSFWRSLASSPMRTCRLNSIRSRRTLSRASSTIFSCRHLHFGNLSQGLFPLRLHLFPSKSYLARFLLVLHARVIQVFLQLPDVGLQALHVLEVLSSLCSGLPPGSIQIGLAALQRYLTVHEALLHHASLLLKHRQRLLLLGLSHQEGAVSLSLDDDHSSLASSSYRSGFRASMRPRASHTGLDALLLQHFLVELRAVQRITQSHLFPGLCEALLQLGN